ncbi:type I-B CRISPR-associated protein Cas7/Csh2 [Geobacillus thermodenitrificans]|jgi:CRISPR-associated protein Csh2|uniref:Type I-B CRISPR-associated protein Cas7/Csh2 n=1 Tax=Geobacillus thermodenitrificans TaxID=33940 RepID=A0ABY9QES5_GEOTD|nr:type I-B CRISPR-associated protein Cas7/Csh2 [Geobacillus thermodenitrificans]MED3906277.1 type I-B CRISPR-associated protein Cas7/Csh2 [Geobacillus thermodenitrificans]WMV76577.1 type I-B CRISPR-associated protein Cas7/Csh2 [Geobacillus thermodenitrificans]
MVKQRSELLFLYDVQWANPNGDPVDGNKPRIDEETGKNIVTDVRLKRTIRDYLYDYRQQEIFVREIAQEDEYIQDAKARAEDFLVKDGEKLDKSKLTLSEMKKIINDEVLRQCIDVRLFGVTLPIEKNQREKSSITHTGPVQFKMGQSLHRVKLEYIKGTGAFASGGQMTQKTFREEYVLPYSLISFYGIINETAARFTRLTEEDVELLIEAMWEGTKNLISRSKVGHVPRLLLRVVYQEPYFHIGELDKYVSLHTEKAEEEIRDVYDYVLDVSRLVEVLVREKENIAKIELRQDGRLVCSEDLAERLRKEGIAVDIR